MNKLVRRFAAYYRRHTPGGRTGLAHKGPRGWAALMASVACAGLLGCQARGDDRPFSSEVPPPPRFAQPAQPPASCTAEGARFALGAAMTAPMLEDMRTRTGAQSVSTVAPGATPPAAMNRLLVEVDAQGRVVGARCA